MYFYGGHQQKLRIEKLISDWLTTATVLPTLKDRPVDSDIIYLIESIKKTKRLKNI